ncbi:SOS response-associated peptidase [Edaphobacter modestus]|uniref:Uncharacterized protein n=1 Tax=Edaphobacter modestus TaxID=388466 RepID=A0A4Q7Y246_9BACT|nr:SOS response-associated peptidase [Edaphobacter modestus]RZU29739.1 hypothetical protein BDD14_6354 [Edaphobacter modestus]
MCGRYERSWGKQTLTEYLQVREGPQLPLTFNLTPHSSQSVIVKDDEGKRQI